MKVKIKVKGGAGSGNWGHAGRPGLVGGSTSRGGAGMGYGTMTRGSGLLVLKGTGVLRQEMMDRVPADLAMVSEEVRGQVKEEVVSDLSKRTGLPEEQVNDYVKQWAFTANDEDMRSLSLQQAAAEEFGVSLSEWQEKSLEYVRQETRNIPPPVSVSSETHPAQFPLMSRTDERALMRATYEATQEWLNQLRFTDPDSTIRLYRGVALEESPGTGSAPYAGNAIESWSTSAETATEFAEQHAGYPDVGIVVSAAVPLKNIVSTARTGPGCLNEGEMLIFGTLPGSEVNVESVFVPEQPEWDK